MAKLTDKQGGRPTKYKEEYNEQVVKLCKLGATDAEIADFFGVCEATINNWKLEDNMFLESIKEGKIIADMNVVNSLYKKAMGFQYVETRIGDNDTVITTKQSLPDTTAIMAWLNNRRPKDFRNKQEVEHSGTIDVVNTELIEKYLKS